MGNRYFILFGALGLAFAGYAVWWFGEAEDLAYRVQGQLFRAMPSNIELDFSVGDVGGFPFRFVVDMQDVRLTIAGDDRFETSQAFAILQPFNEGHVIVSFPEPVNYAIKGGGSGVIAPDRALASFVWPEGGKLRIDLDSKDLTIDSKSGNRLTVGRAGLHVRDESVAPGHAYSFSISTDGIRRGDPDAPAGAVKAEGRLQHRDMGDAGAVEIGFQPHQLEKIEITKYAFETEGMAFDMQYGWDYTDPDSPSLTVNASASPSAKMLAGMRAENVMNSAAFATVLSRYGADDGSGGLTLDLVYRHGEMTLNGHIVPEQEVDGLLSTF